MNRYLPGEGAAAAAAADEEEGGEERGGRGGDEDVEPALRPQLRAAPRQAAEEEHVLVPVGARGFVSTKIFSIRHNLYCSQWSGSPVSGEVDEVLVAAGVVVGGGGEALAVEPAGLQRGAVVPDVDIVDGAHHHTASSHSGLLAT